MTNLQRSISNYYYIAGSLLVDEVNDNPSAALHFQSFVPPQKTKSPPSLKRPSYQNVLVRM